MAQPVCLKYLLQQQRWQNHRTFCHEYDKTARSIDPRLAGTAPSRAQLHRWLSGELKGLPYGDHCRILEKMFPGWTAEELFEPCSSPEEVLRIPRKAVQPHSANSATSSTTETTQTKSQQPKALPIETTHIIESIPHCFPVEILNGPWVTSYKFKSERGIKVHADITYISARSDRRITAKNYPPEPSQNYGPSYCNEIEAQLANRHLIGHWRNINDTRYFGSFQLAVLQGENLMKGYYTSFLSDIKVDAMSWIWIRLDPASYSNTDLSQVMLKEPNAIYTLLTQTTDELTLPISAITEKD